MFKRAEAVRSTGQHQLKSSDVRKLRKDLLASLDREGDEATEKVISKLLPSKSEVMVYKTSNKSLIYTDESGSPVAFDPEGRGKLVPSLYVLWKFPDAMPSLTTYSEVSPKVLGGADLMLPGVIVPEGEVLTKWETHDLMCVKVPGNVYPFAVGSMEVSHAEAVESGMKGRGLRLLHFYGDCIWEMGDKSAPNEGFTVKRIFPSEGKAETKEEAAVKPPKKKGAGDDGQIEQAVEVKMEQLDVKEEPKPDCSQQTLKDSLSGEELIELCMFRAIVKTPDSSLPMLSSNFYSAMLSCRPEGSTVDIKKTSYKKLSKLLSTFEKKRLLTTKSIHKNEHVNTINRESKLLLAFLEREEEEEQSGTSSSAETGMEDSLDTSEKRSQSKISIDIVYKPSSSLRAVFGERAADDREAMFSESEVLKCLKAYAKAESLAVGKKDMLMDSLLVGALINKKERETIDLNMPVNYSEVMEKLLPKLSSYHRLTRTTSAGQSVAVGKGDVKNIKISVEDRGSRKYITKVSGLEGFAISPEDVASVAQKKFAASTSVQALPGKNEHGKEISIQGKVPTELYHLLIEDYGLPSEFIDSKGR